MKRIVSMLLALILLLGITACGNGMPATQTNPNSIPSVQSTTTAPNTTVPTTDLPLRQIKVALDANGGSCQVTELLLMADQCYGELPEPVLDGYVFVGWFTEREGGIPVAPETVLTAEGDHIIYAHWELKTQFVVTLDPNGGRISPYAGLLNVTVNAPYGELPEPIREGYIFQGWYTEPEKGTKVSSATEYTAWEDGILYAQWKYDALSYWTSFLSNRVQTIPQCRRVVVYLEKNAGYKTYIDCPFLDDAGAINASADLEEGKTTDAWIREVNPYIIIKLTTDIDLGLVSKIAMQRRFPDQEIYIFTTRAISGSEQLKIYYRLQLAEILYPEYFEDLDLAKVAKELNIKPRIYY